MTIFSQTSYVELARAVLAGMPIEEAEKKLEEQRQKGGAGEEHFWLTLENNIPDTMTTIQVSRSIKDKLNELKITPRETYNDVLKKLILVYKLKVVETNGGIVREMD